jgi:multidrug efflux pump subunit AcrB
MGKFLFRPMFLAVAFAMGIAYFLSRTFVPTRCASWLKSHGHKPIESHTYDYEHRNIHENLPAKGGLARLFERWESVINRGIALYGRLLEKVLSARVAAIATAFGLLAVVVVLVGPQLRREFFPEVDAGSFEIYVRAKSGTKIEVTEEQIERVEQYVKKQLGDDLDLVVSEIGLTADWSAAFTPNAGPMDAVVKVQLKAERSRSAQEYVDILRRGFQSDPAFAGGSAAVDLEFAFDAGGMIRAAMNEGKSTPINIRITAKDLPGSDERPESRGLVKARKIAERMLAEVRRIDGVVDARILQRLDYPQYEIEVDQTAASKLQLTQVDVMKNIVASLNSSVQFNKRNFWIDPKSHNQYYVGVQYPEKAITSLETLKNIQITSRAQKKSVPLDTIAKFHLLYVPAEVVHTNLQPTIDLTMGVHGRDLGHVAEDVERVVAKYGKELADGGWAPYDPDVAEPVPMEGAKVVLSGEYQKMQQTFRNQALGMILAVVLIYFLMVALFKSYITPLVVMCAVPVGVVGVILMLWLTGTALNVQSLLGVIFMVGIVVSNTVLMTDYAQNIRRSENLTPTEAIRKAAAIRVRPVVMTALATFFALVPMALGVSRGSEANVPLGRAVLGGLLAGLVTTLFVVPAVFSLLVRGEIEDEDEDDLPGHLPPPEGGNGADEQ